MNDFFDGLTLKDVVTPAVVASLIIFVHNAFADKKKAARDFVTKSFDVAREDVRRAVESSVEYFAEDFKGRTPGREAKVLMGERDVRHSVTLLIEFCTPESRSQIALQSALDDFIDHVTGGSFQSVKAKADLEQVRKVASSGAELRAAIISARQIELHDAVYSDWTSRKIKSAHTYLIENLGVAGDESDSLR